MYDFMSWWTVGMAFLMQTGFVLLFRSGSHPASGFAAPRHLEMLCARTF